MTGTNSRSRTGQACLSLLAFILDILAVNDIQQDLERNDDVGVDDCASLAALIVRETLRVNDSHLFDNGRLA